MNRRRCISAFVVALTWSIATAATPKPKAGAASTVTVAGLVVEPPPALTSDPPAPAAKAKHDPKPAPQAFPEPSPPPARADESGPITVYAPPVLPPEENKPVEIASADPPLTPVETPTPAPSADAASAPSPASATDADKPPPPPDDGAGHIQIITVPPGAAITVDGKAWGMSPVAIDLPPGQYLVSAKLDTYRDGGKVLKVATGDKRDWTIKLRPEAPH